MTEIANLGRVNGGRLTMTEERGLGQVRKKGEVQFSLC